jgi:ADP-ribose pyrophosphatase
MDYEIIKEETVYSGFFKMIKYTISHSLFKGGKSEPFTREVFERGNAVAVLLEDPIRDEIVLIEQFRIGALASKELWVTDIVAGMVEEGETSEDVARREAEEESGAKIESLELINTFYNSVGGCSESTDLYYAKIDASKVEGIHGLDHENEDIRVVKLSRDKFFTQLKAGKFRAVSLVTAGYWLLSKSRGCQ